MNADEQRIDNALWDCYENEWVNWDYASYDSISYGINTDKISDEYPFLNLDWIDEIWNYPCFDASDLVEEYLKLWRKNPHEVYDK